MFFLVFNKKMFGFQLNKKHVFVIFRFFLLLENLIPFLMGFLMQVANYKCMCYFMVFGMCL